MHPQARRDAQRQTQPLQTLCCVQDVRCSLYLFICNFLPHSHSLFYFCFCLLFSFVLLLFLFAVFPICLANSVVPLFSSVILAAIILILGHAFIYQFLPSQTSCACVCVYCSVYVLLFIEMNAIRAMFTTGSIGRQNACVFHMCESETTLYTHAPGVAQ